MLVLTVTRQCELRCAYCQTAGDGWPTLTAADCERALQIYIEKFGGGDVKLFGGEPLLAAEATRATIEAAQRAPEIHRVYLSTNGIALDEDWLALLNRTPKLVLTLSLDGRASDHDRFRRFGAGGGGSFAQSTAMLESLVKAPRVVVTQTIAPQMAARVDENLLYLLGLGFHRFNLLPVYFRPWNRTQLLDLRAAFHRVQKIAVSRWEQGERFYLRNLFTWAPSPFFNRGFVVDVNRRIYPSNMGLWEGFGELLERSCVGDLDRPPTPKALAEAHAQLDGWIEESVEPDLWRATRAADQELTRLCRRLYPALIRYRLRARGAA